MIQLTKRELNKLNTRKAKVAKLKNDLRKYFDASGDMSLPDIECTCIGYSPMGLVETYDMKDKEGNVIGFHAYIDSLEYTVVYIEDGEDVFLAGWEELEDDLKYQRRRLNKAWRVFKAENPDAELERDNEED